MQFQKDFLNYNSSGFESDLRMINQSNSVAGTKLLQVFIFASPVSMETFRIVVVLGKRGSPVPRCQPLATFPVLWRLIVHNS